MALMGWRTKAAEGGDSLGQYYLGLSFYNGEGVARDLVVALKWFELAAAQGYLGSCNGIACIFYSSGVGVERDYAKAVLWWKKGADGGHAYSQYCLGDCYLKGEGVLKDLIVARDWFKKSADQGNDNAKFELGKMLLVGKGGKKDFRQGMELIM
jgi:TPR repeat protein